MYYKTCPYCGAHLDPGEKCTCQGEKEGEAAPLARERPQKPKTSISLSVAAPVVKPEATNALRELRLEYQIPVKDMVAVVRELYPKYDKTLQSKCENGDAYGVDLRPDAELALYARFAPAAHRNRRKDRHRLTHRLSVRLENGAYGALQRRMAADGYDTAQALLTMLVLRYIQEEAEA